MTIWIKTQDGILSFGNLSNKVKKYLRNNLDTGININYRIDEETAQEVIYKLQKDNIRIDTINVLPGICRAKP